MNELHTNTDTDADKYILNCVEFTPNEVIEIMTNFLQKQQFRVGRLTARIAELEEKQRWIPVSERLPDNWKSVLTIDMSESTRDMVTAFYNPETSLWSTHFSCDLWVTHWMPLPEPPIVYGKVCEE